MTSATSVYGSATVSHQAKSLNLKYFNLGVLAIIACLGIFYLINISNLTVLGFVLRDLKSEVSVLASEKLAKEEAVNRVRSYQALSDRTKNLNMVAIGEVEYIRLAADVVAMK